MSISKFEYSQAVGRFAPKMKIISQEYQDASQRNLENSNDLENLKEDWMKCVGKFRELQTEYEELEVPKGYEEDGAKLVRYYTEFIDAIEKKSKNFGLESMNNRELERLKNEESEAGVRLTAYTYELSKKMFGR